jgi:hypothetical protein
MAALPHLRRHLSTPSLRRRWLLAAYALLLSPLPLVGALGYECSLALTAPCALLGVFVGVDAARGSARGHLAPTLHTIALAAAGDLLQLCGAALLVLMLAQVYNPSCDPWGGLLFFILGPVFSASLGAISGIWGAALVQSPPRRWSQVLVGLVPLLFCLIVGLLRLYVDPVVFALDPFWGYFAGPLYDEGVVVDARYLRFRAYNLLLAAAALAAFRLWGERLLNGARAASSASHLEPAAALARLHRRPWSLLILLAGLGGGAYFGLRPAQSGFHATLSGIAEALPAERITEHFIIRYAPTSDAAREIDVIAAEHEFAWHRHAATLGRAPGPKIHSFIFPNPELKRRVIGAGATEVAPPWRLHLYLNYQPFPAAVMPHELAHAFSSVVGDPIFGVAGSLGARGLRLNLALVEGFATALAPRPRDGLDLHDTAAALDRLDLRPPLTAIMGVAFWGQASRRAYTAAGSFCRWLLEQQGAERLAALYRSAGDFEAVYGATLLQLEAAWLDFLRARPLRTQDIELMRQIFEQRPIFQRPCAHRSAHLRAEAAAAAARGLDDRALEALSELCLIEPERPEHQIQRAHALAEAGYRAEAEALLRERLTVPGLTVTLRALAHQHLGDLALLRGDLIAAEQAWSAALASSAGEEQQRALQIRLLAARDPQIAPLIRAYFLSFEPAALRATAPLRRLDAAHRLSAAPTYGAIGAYLLGLQLLGAGEPALAAARLERALTPLPGERPLPSPELVRAARLTLINALTRIRDYDRAAGHLVALRAEPGLGQGHIFTYQEWAERLEFFRVYAPAPPRPLPPRPLTSHDDDPEDPEDPAPEDPAPEDPAPEDPAPQPAAE